MCAAARTEQKYSIPRNPLMPEPSVLEILFSGPLLKTREGNAEPIPVPLFRATDEPGSQFSMQKRGVFYRFKFGDLYVYDGARTVALQLFDGAALAAAFVLPGVSELAGGLSELVHKGGEMLIETVGDKIKERQAPAQTTFGDQVRMLESRGVVLLAGANLVDVEYQVEPAGFLSKEIHRVIYTYEDTQHHLARYQTGAPSKGKKADAAKMMIDLALKARMWAETEYLFQRVKGEYAPAFDATISEMRAAFDREQGDGAAARSQEFAKEVTDRFQAEIERNGFTLATGARRVLELLEPMREVYDSTPMLSVMMQNLGAMAAGRTE